jgi:hypothetical protein
VRALTGACLKGYNGEGPWKEFPETVFETFMGIVKNAFVENVGGPPVESTWVEFFFNNIYPELLRGVLLKHHPDQDSYVITSVIVDGMRKALQREEEIVGAHSENSVTAGSVHHTIPAGNIETATFSGVQNQPLGAPSEPMEKSVTTGSGHATILADNIETVTFGGVQNQTLGAPLEPLENSVTTGSGHATILAGNIQAATLSGVQNKPPVAPSEPSENSVTTGSGHATNPADNIETVTFGGVQNLVAPLEPSENAEPTKESSEETQAQENKKDDGSMLVLDILKRQLSCVIDKRYKSVEDYVPKAILTLTPEEVKVMDAKKDLAANDAIKSVIEWMKEDYGGGEDDDSSADSEDSFKTNKYPYSEDEVKRWFDSLKKCFAYDLGFAADPGTDDKKCWCPCW